VWIRKSPFSGRFSAVLLVLAFLAPLAASPRRAGGSQTAQQLSTPAKVAADSPRITPGGTSFKVPSEWSIATGKNIVVLQPPEPDTHIAIVDVPASDARNAVSAAWAAYKPEFKRPIKLVTPRPAKEGWAERQIFDYETSPNERAAVQAFALRAGTGWTVAIVDGTDPTVEKRSAAIGLVFASLRPKDYKRESFAGRTAHPLDDAHIVLLKRFVEDSMRQLGVPGVGMALIDNGRVVYQGRLGVRQLGKPELVDENTVFMAAWRLARTTMAQLRSSPSIPEPLALNSSLGTALASACL